MQMKVVAALAALVAAAVGGYQYADALRGEEVSALREDYANRAAALEAKYREREKANARAVVAAWEERDRARADATDLSAELERLRSEADAARRELSRAPDDPCAAYRAKLAESAEIIERGARLAVRCSRLAEDVAADKDALARIVRP